MFPISHIHLQYIHYGLEKQALVKAFVQNVIFSPQNAVKQDSFTFHPEKFSKETERIILGSPFILWTHLFSVTIHAPYATGPEWWPDAEHMMPVTVTSKNAPCEIALRLSHFTGEDSYAYHALPFAHLWRAHLSFPFIATIYFSVLFGISCIQNW